MISVLYLVGSPSKCPYKWENVVCVLFLVSLLIIMFAYLLVYRGMPMLQSVNVVENNGYKVFSATRVDLSNSFSLPYTSLKHFVLFTYQIHLYECENDKRDSLQAFREQ